MKHLRILCLACALTALAACQPKSAVHNGASAVVATVDGVPITRALYEYYVKGVSGKDSSALTPEQRALALDSLIRAQAVAQQAHTQGLDKQGDTASLLTLSRLNILEQALSDNFFKGRTPSDAELQAEYNTQVAKLPKLEYHAEHILVKDQATAQQVIQDLNHGQKFAALAKKYSIDPSKDNGGDLGWFPLTRMVKPFSDALAQLKVGQYTQTPVQTQFGWHVIELLGTRPLAPPPFDAVKSRLLQMVEGKQFRAYTDTLIGKDKVVTYLDTKTDSETKGSNGPPALDTSTRSATAP